MRKLLRAILALPSAAEREYATPERLADVMALIQVLALDKEVHRSETGLQRELQGFPKSATNKSATKWTDIARHHPEFFRVQDGRVRPVSLVARHVLPRESSGEDGTISPDYVASLLQAAIDIHDRQVRRCERWTYLIPIWVALIGGACMTVVVLIRMLCGELPLCWNSLWPSQ